jgi:MFS family permease
MAVRVAVWEPRPMRAVRERVRVLGDVWRDRDLRAAQLAWGGFHTAEWASLVALSVLAYGTHGPQTLGVVLFLRMLACALVTPWVAVLADRVARERILLAAHAVRSVSFAGAAIAALAGGGATTVYAFAIASGVPLSSLRPCHLGLVPVLARSPAQLTAANVGTMTLESAAGLVGPVGAGLLLAVADAGAVFAGCALLAVASALAIARVSADAHSAVGTRRGIAAELGEGLRGITGNAHVRLVVGLFAAQTLVRGFLAVLVVVIALDLTALGEPGVGLLSAALGVGGLAGAVAAVGFVGRGGVGRPFALALAFWGLPLALIGLAPVAAVAFVALAVVGLANTVLDVAGFTSIQERADERLLGRIFGLFELLVIVTVGVGSLAAPALVEAVGARTALVLAGLLLPLLALACRPGLARLDDGTEARAVDVDLLRGSPIFAPLPYLVVRRLARALGTRTASAGETLMREGDAGDVMYVLERGEASVVVGSRRVAQLGPGDVFGEIALLLDVPRTATVTAATDVSLRTLPREPFLAAVAGHRLSGPAARDLVDARLRRTHSSGNA